MVAFCLTYTIMSTPRRSITIDKLISEFVVFTHIQYTCLFIRTCNIISIYILLNIE